MAKYKVMIGKNGTGKTTKLFNLYKNGCKVQYMKIVHQGEKLSKVDTLLFIPSLRIDSILATGRIDNSLNIEDYVEYVREVAFNVSDVSMYNESIHTKLIKKEFFLYFVTNFEQIFDDEDKGKLLELFPETRIFLQKYVEYERNLDEELRSDYQTASDGFKTFAYIIGQVKYYIKFLEQNRMKKKITIFIDEIENHLHPESIKLLLHMLDSSLSTNSEVHMTTHNPISLYSIPKGKCYVENLSFDGTEAQATPEAAGCGKDDEEVTSGRHMTLDRILKEVFKIDSILEADLRFFELVDKYLLDGLNEEEFHEIHCIIEKKKREDMGFYREYITYIQLICDYCHDKEQNV